VVGRNREEGGNRGTDGGGVQIQIVSINKCNTNWIDQSIKAVNVKGCEDLSAAVQRASKGLGLPL
jgi:hypothetical protein